MSVKKRLLRIFVILFLLAVFVGYFTFATLIFKPFEADYEFDVAALIPAKVDFFVAKAKLGDAFDRFPRLAVMDELEQLDSWRTLRASPEFNDQIEKWGLSEEFLDEIRRQVERIPLGMEPQDLFGGRDVAIAGNFKGRQLSQADWALYGRVNWAGKLAVALLDYPGLIGLESRGITTSEGDGFVHLSGGQLERPLYITRIRDVVILSTALEFVEAAHTRANTSGAESMFISAAYNDYIRRASRGPGEREFEVYIDLRALLANLQLQGPWPNTASERFIPAFLGRLVQAPSCNRVVGVLGLRDGVQADLYGSFSSELITPEQTRIYRAPGFTPRQLLNPSGGVAGFAPEDVAMFVYVHGPVADLLRLVFASVEPALRQNMEDAFRSTGRYDSLDELIDQLAGGLHNRLAFVLRANDYKQEEDGPRHDSTPVFAMTLITWTKEGDALEGIRDVIGMNPSKFGLQGGSPAESGYYRFKSAGYDTREFWSPFVPGTGIVATMNTEEHCFITNNNQMLQHVLRSYRERAERGYPSLADRQDFQALLDGSLPSANLLVWINPRAAGTTLRAQADHSAQTAVELSIDWVTQRGREEQKALQELFTGRRMDQLSDDQKHRLEGAVNQSLQLYREQFIAEQVPLVRAAREREITYLESISSILMMLRLEPKQFKLSVRVNVPM